MHNKPIQSNWTPINAVDVTADQTALDGSNSGYRFTDFTVGRQNLMAELPPGKVTIQVCFQGEGANNGDSFACQLLGAGNDGICQEICDITGVLGSGWCDITDQDATTRLWVDDLTVSEFSLWNDITTGNLLSNGPGFIEFTSRGITQLSPRFYNVGDATEITRIKAYMRFR